MGYELGRAMTHLQAENLLDAVLLPGPDGCRRVDPMDPCLAELNASFQGAGLDSRHLIHDALFVALAGENADGRQFIPDVLTRGHWALTRSVSDSDPLVGLPVAGGGGVLLSPDPVGALACLARGWRRSLDLKILAITGTNGKTTTKDLARALLAGAGPTQATRGNFNNELGVPLTLLGLQSEARFAVVEMGASAVGDIDFLAGVAAPDVGIITNASAAHLEKFGSLENIVQGKGELLDHLSAQGTAILNADSPGFLDWQSRAAGPVVSWGRRTGDHRWEYEAQESLLILDGEGWPVPLPGLHNAANLCAAILACRALGVADQNLREGLTTFEASGHRSRLLTWRGRRVLDDCYNANPGSMQAAVHSLVAMKGKGRALAVLGRMAELGPDSAALHHETGRILSALGLDGLLAVGAGTEALVRGHAEKNPAHTQSLAHCEEAFAWLCENSRAGDAVLVKGSRSAGMEELIKLMEEDTPS